MRALHRLRKALLTATILSSFVLLSCNKTDEFTGTYPKESQTIEQLKILLPNDALTIKLADASKNWLILAKENAKPTSFIHQPKKINEFILALESTNSDRKQIEALLLEHFTNVPALMEAINEQFTLCEKLQTKYPSLIHLETNSIEELNTAIQNTLLEKNDIYLSSAADCKANLEADKNDCLLTAVAITVGGGIAGGGFGALVAGVGSLFALDNCYGTANRIYELCMKLENK